MTVMRARRVVPDDSDSIEGLLPSANFARLLEGENHPIASDPGFPTRRDTKARAVIPTHPGQQNYNRLSFQPIAWFVPGGRGQLTRSLIPGMWPPGVSWSGFLLSENFAYWDVAMRTL